MPPPPSWRANARPSRGTSQAGNFLSRGTLRMGLTNLSPGYPLKLVALHSPRQLAQKLRCVANETGSRDAKRQMMAGDGAKKPIKTELDVSHPFRLADVFPDAQGILDIQYKSLMAMKDAALVSLDANVLLLPYEMDNVSLSKIVEVYKSLAHEKRIVITAQAVR
jgi:hypothetical protein